MKDEGNEFTGIDQVMHGIAHYKKMNQRLIVAVACASLTAVISTSGLTALALQDPVIRSYAVSPDLRIKELEPLMEAAISDAGLTNWAAETATEAISLNFLHYKKQLANIQSNFTPECFNEFFDGLKKSGNLQYIIDKRLNVKAVPSEPPIIINRGHIGNRYVWQVEFPVRIAYETSQGTGGTIQNNIVSMMIVRIPFTEHPRGVAVMQFILKPR